MDEQTNQPPSDWLDTLVALMGIGVLLYILYDSLRKGWYLF